MSRIPERVTKISVIGKDKFRTLRLILLHLGVTKADSQVAQSSPIRDKRSRRNLRQKRMGYLQIFHECD